MLQLKLLLWSRSVPLMGRVGPWLLLVFWGAATSGRADEPVPPLATLWTTAGEQFTGSWIGVDDRHCILRIGGLDQQIPQSSLWQLVISSPTSRPIRPNFWLHLTNGDRLGCTTVHLSDEVLEFQLTHQGEVLKLGFEFIVGIQPLRTGTSWRTDESEWQQVIHQREKSDLVVLRNGDHHAGEVSGMGGQSLQLTGSLGQQDIAWSAISGFLTNLDLAEVPQRPATSWMLLMTDDSWLTVTSLTTKEAGGLKLTTMPGIEWTIPRSTVRWATHWGPEVTPLSHRDIAEQKHLPLWGEMLTVVMDRNARGLPLRSPAFPTPVVEHELSTTLPGLSPLGLGMTSGMTVRWNLAGEFRRLQCGFGLDATACAEGHTVVTLRVDDQPPKSITLKADQPIVLETAVDLTGAKTLTIETSFGESGDACDWINFYSPMLIR